MNKPRQSWCSWQALGYALLIFVVGLKGVPRPLYEAAMLDGTTGLQAFWRITVPMLRHILLYVSVVTLVSGCNVYARPSCWRPTRRGRRGGWCAC